MAGSRPCWIYQGDLLCENCTHVAQARLTPADSSDEYPQARGTFDESDMPIHCSGCHKFLGGCLTTEGRAYVQERVDAGARVAVDVWGPYYGITPTDADVMPECPECGGAGDSLGVLGTAHWFRCRGCGLDFKRAS